MKRVAAVILGILLGCGASVKWDDRTCFGQAGQCGAKQDKEVKPWPTNHSR